ncbi:hypothetical protein OsJ_18968 [Oryza sativa Japonica Group]|uniref:CCHC-type domain-containing protein n=1 Tax=Oryza sativa subsp. japonica TaxID=39947 RepID=B9FKT7_ORYSJ|nr:hypothetical protein OsJ_18968 [Oryza sativa Japonica Group]
MRPGRRWGYRRVAVALAVCVHAAVLLSAVVYLSSVLSAAGPGASSSSLQETEMMRLTAKLEQIIGRPPHNRAHLPSHAFAPSKSGLATAIQALDWGTDAEEDEDDVIAPELHQRSAETFNPQTAKARKAASPSPASKAFHQEINARSQEEELDITAERGEGQSAITPPPEKAQEEDAEKKAREKATLKSIIVAPARATSKSQIEAEEQDLSSKWQAVKPKFWWRKRQNPSSSTSQVVFNRPATSFNPLNLREKFKEILHGKCFRCFASDHQAAACRDPIRCYTCRRSGHISFRCPNKSKQPIHSRLTFPKQAPSIQSRLIFPPLPSKNQQQPTTTRPGSVFHRLHKPAVTMDHIPGLPNQRPAVGYATVPMTELMQHELERLHYHGALISAEVEGQETSPREVARALTQQVGIPISDLRVTRHHPEDFFVFFDFPEGQAAAARRGFITLDGGRFTITPWSADRHVHHPNWWFRVRLCLEGLPQYAWNRAGLEGVMGPICLFDRIEHKSVQWQNTAIFSCWMWMRNPDLLP